MRKDGRDATTTRCATNDREKIKASDASIKLQQRDASAHLLGRCSFIGAVNQPELQEHKCVHQPLSCLLM